MSEQKRLSVNINGQSADLLRGYMDRSGVEITEAVRRFVGVAGFILAAIDKGDEILLRRGGGVERVVFDLSSGEVGHGDHVHVAPIVGGEVSGQPTPRLILDNDRLHDELSELRADNERLRATIEQLKSREDLVAQASYE